MAILGIMPSNAFENVLNPRSLENLMIIPPEKALKSLLPEVRKKADFIILLSQYRFEATTMLINAVDGIDLAISRQSQRSKHPSKNAKTPVMQIRLRGESLGSLELTIDDTGQIIRSQGKMIKLDKSVASNVRIVKMIDDAYLKNAKEVKIMRAKKERRALDKEARELWKLTPQEYIETLNKEQSQAGGKR